MSTTTIDYDALAAQHGGSATIDYDALAAQHGGMASESRPSLDLSNPNRQGIYQMKGTQGQTVGVPYGEVQKAAQLGYGFASDADKFRYAKDNAADPNRTSSFTPAAGDPRASVQYQQQMERESSLPMQVIGGAAKAGGTLMRPILDVTALATRTSPEQVSGMLAPQTATQAAAKYGTMGAAVIPAAVAAPVATAGALVGGTVGAGTGALAGNIMHLSPEETQVLEDIGGIAGGTVGGQAGTPAVRAIKGIVAKNFPTFFVSTPEGALTQAVRGSVNKNNIGWKDDAPLAMSLMKTAEQEVGKPVQNLDDAIQANTIAKKNIWAKVQSRLAAAGKMGATIDGNQIADAMVNSIDRRTAAQNPAIVERVKAVADTYRRPMTVEEAEDFLQSTNSDLNTYYAKNKTNQRVALGDPETAYKVAEGDALRAALNSKLDELQGSGSAMFKRAYGALANVGKVLNDRWLVNARQAPVSLGEQIATARGVGQALKGAGKVIASPVTGGGSAISGLSDIAEGAGGIVTSKAIKQLNSTDSLIARAFQQAQAAPPFPESVSPRVAGLLQRGPIQTPPPVENFSVPDYQPPAFSNTTRAERLGLLLPEKSGAPSILPYNHEMSEGERVAALMHALRSKQQLALPAKGTPIQLPASKAASLWKWVTGK